MVTSRPRKSKKGKHKIFIVDDHPLVREGLTRFINLQPDMKVCGESATTYQALKAIPVLKPDVIILDLTLADANGLDLIKDMKSRSLKINSGKGRFCPASFCGYSSVHFKMNQATGFKSAAVTSQPNRIASNGIAPPPANGSSIFGACPPFALRISSRSLERVALFSISRFQRSMPPSVISFTRPSLSFSVFSLQPIFSQSSLRPSGVPGSGSSVASSAARDAASGRRAGQRCNVEI